MLKRKLVNYKIILKPKLDLMRKNNKVLNKEIVKVINIFKIRVNNLEND